MRPLATSESFQADQRQTQSVRIDIVETIGSTMSPGGDDSELSAKLNPTMDCWQPEHPETTDPSTADAPFEINANATLDEMVSALAKQQPGWLDSIDEDADAPVVMLFGGLLEGIDCPLYQIKNAMSGAVLAERETRKLADKRESELRKKLGTKLKVEHVYQPSHDIEVVEYWKRENVLNPLDKTDPRDCTQSSEQGTASLPENIGSVTWADGVPTETASAHNAPRQNEENSENTRPQGGIDAAANVEGPRQADAAGETQTRPQTGKGITDILPEKQQMLTRIKDSIEALASVFHETKAILVTDYPFHVVRHTILDLS